jgi:hypothetical protein
MFDSRPQIKKSSFNIYFIGLWKKGEHC